MHKIIHMKHKTLPYSHTGRATPSFDKSINEIKTLLLKFKCERFQVGEDRRGEEPLITLWFERMGQVYKLDFPVTYINKSLDMRVSGRIMYHHIKALLVAAEIEYLDFSQIMMGYRALPDGKGGAVTIQDAYAQSGDALPAVGFDIRLLPKGE